MVSIWGQYWLVGFPNKPKWPHLAHASLFRLFRCFLMLVGFNRVQSCWTIHWTILLMVHSKKKMNAFVHCFFFLFFFCLLFICCCCSYCCFCCSSCCCCCYCCCCYCFCWCCSCFYCFIVTAVVVTLFIGKLYIIYFVFINSSPLPSIVFVVTLLYCITIGGGGSTDGVLSATAMVLVTATAMAMAVWCC